MALFPKRQDNAESLVRCATTLRACGQPEITKAPRGNMSDQSDGIRQTTALVDGVDASNKKFALGVLLVHGIGKQRSGETLVRWGDALLDVIHRGTMHRVVPTIERASLGDATDGRAEAVIDLRFGKQPERWLLAEGWWAKSFLAPTYGELVSWSVRALPWSIGVHIAQRYRLAVSREAKRWTKVFALLTALGQLLVALALTPVFIALLAVALLLGVLPIPQLRAIILAAQSALTATVGDSLAFVESPMRAALIRTRILDELKRLKNVCDRTVIIAHSQGAAAVLDALGGIIEPDFEEEAATKPEPPVQSPVPDTLLTFGAGTNKLVSLKVLSAGLSKKIGWNPTYVAFGGLFATAGLFAWLLVDIQAQRISIQDILYSFLLWSVTLLVIGVVMAGGKRLITRIPVVQNLDDDYKIWSLVILIFVVLGGSIWYAHSADLPLGTVSFLGVALMILVVSIMSILSTEMETVVKAPVRKPPGLARWIDVYASADPVPNGPTRTRESKDELLQSVPIWNQGSSMADHTAYWDNLDGFVLRAARAFAETAKSAWVSALPPENDNVDDRAEWRVSLLRLILWMTRFAWVYLFMSLWWQYGARIPLPFQLPDWLSPVPVTTTRFAVLAALIGLFTWATSGTLRSIWKLWVRSEQNAVLNHDHPTSNWLYLGVMMAVPMLVLLLAIGVLRLDTDMVVKLIADPKDLIGSLATVLGWVVLPTILLSWRRPPPKWREPDASASGDQNPPAEK